MKIILKTKAAMCLCFFYELQTAPSKTASETDPRQLSSMTDKPLTGTI